MDGPNAPSVLGFRQDDQFGPAAIYRTTFEFPFCPAAAGEPGCVAVDLHANVGTSARHGLGKFDVRAEMLTRVFLPRLVMSALHNLSIQSEERHGCRAIAFRERIVKRGDNASDRLAVACAWDWFPARRKRGDRQEEANRDESVCSPPARPRGLLPDTITHNETLRRLCAGLNAPATDSVKSPTRKQI